jgi:hypothetical protein
MQTVYAVQPPPQPITIEQGAVLRNGATAEKYKPSAWSTALVLGRKLANFKEDRKKQRRRELTL